MRESWLDKTTPAVMLPPLTTLRGQEARVVAGVATLEPFSGVEFDAKGPGSRLCVVLATRSVPIE